MGSLGTCTYHGISRVAIIGAGPVGVACAKYLLAEKAFEKIDIFEQRDGVGGVWNLSPTERTRRIPIPQEDPRYGWNKVTASINGGASDQDRSFSLNNDSLEFESPLYDYLETNIPKEMMQYSDTPFPDHFPLYPSHEETLEYLEKYADDVKSLIQFETQVQNVRLLKDTSGSRQDRWELTSRRLRDDRTSQTAYDAVIVSNGHYTIPHVVHVNGLAEWNKAFPGSILHSKAYRRPEDFSDQRVLVIGNSASGTDLSVQIGPLSSRLYLSSKSESMFGGGVSQAWKEDIDEVVEFLPTEQYTRAVRTKSGRIIDNLDTIIFATGYFYSFPFLSELDPPIITDGLRTRDVYQHFLHIEYPTLALPVINLKVIPFGLAENQAAVIARLWSGRLPIPSKEEMRKWETEMFAAKGTGKQFHLKKFPEDAAQMNDLYRWALSAESRSGLENKGVGKLGMHWDHVKIWERSKFADIKMAYSKKGNDRRNVRTVEELGFDYATWRQTAKPEDLAMFEKAKCLDV